jgi:hypothetical protein
MKKLLIIITVFSIFSLNAQPVAINTTLRQAVYNKEDNVDSLRGDLVPLVFGGTPPYQFTADRSKNKNAFVSVIRDGEYAGSFTATPFPRAFVGESQFEYKAIDSTGQESNPATVTIIFGQEKG